MSTRIKDRHLLGAGAAACTLCCAPPLLALLGIAGAGAVATIATIAIAAVTFGAVVLAAAVVGLWARKRAHRADLASHCANDENNAGPVDVTIGTAPGENL